MSNLEDVTGAENTSTSDGGFFHNLGSFIAAILLFTFFWPLLVPFYGTSANFVKESPWNYILEVAWLVMIFVFIRQLRKTRHR